MYAECCSCMDIFTKLKKKKHTHTLDDRAFHNEDKVKFCMLEILLKNSINEHAYGVQYNTEATSVTNE